MSLGKDPDPVVRLDELLRWFRETHDQRAVEVGRDRWQYMIGGTTDRVVIIVGGGGSTAESMFAVNAGLELSARVVSLGIPATVSTTEAVVIGIRSILELLNIRQAIFLGHSLGGLVIQALAFRHPECVEGMVLSNTGFYLGLRATLMPVLAEFMAHMPNALVLRSVSHQMNRMLKSVEAPRFWQHFFQEELNRTESGERLRQQFALLANLTRFFRINPISTAGPWFQSIPVQIISSEDDKGFTPAERAFLSSLYQNSHTTTFPMGSTHLSFLSRPQEYIQVVQDFIASVDQSPALRE